MSDAFTRREFLATTVAAATILPSGALAWGAEAKEPAATFEPVKIPEWIHRVSVMGFGSQGDLPLMAQAGVQLLHTNLIWPYFPLRRDGGGLSADDAAKLRELVAACRQHKIRLSLGLPPFPSVELVRAHPDWRIHDEPTGKILQVAPEQDNLGTRIGCNLGPWDYLIEICGELIADFGVDGYSFDGNYHPPICYCPACRQKHEAERGMPLPKQANLDDVEYRHYLAWRGEKLEDHYRRLQQRIKRSNPEAVLTSWTVNAGRFGHFLHSPRAMPTRMNLLFDLPMQEWWLDETNIGASVAPAFGAAYLHAVTNGRPCASEPYLMSRGNPYGTDSFPKHERLTRTLLALTHGNVSAQSFGWPGHRESSVDVCQAVAERAPWMLRAEPVRWAAMLVSEQTRQFYAYRDIRERFLPHVFGEAFRAALEEHLPLRLINDWDVTADGLGGYRVLVLPNAAALSDTQLAAVRKFVAAGGGLVAIGESSLCNEWGESRGDFGLADVFGVSFRGRPASAAGAAPLDENFARNLDENYWKERVGLATLKWREHPLTNDERLSDLVPSRSVIFRGPQCLVSEPANRDEVVCHLTPDGKGTRASPALVARTFGKGKVVYLAAALDAALWSYSYPYQRRLLARTIEWAAAGPAPIRVQAPMCAQAGYFRQRDAKGERCIVHLFNNLNTTGQHGLPAAEVPLREETVPIAGIRVQFLEQKPKRCHAEPGGLDLPMTPSADGRGVEVTLPMLELHSMVVAEL